MITLSETSLTDKFQIDQPDLGLDREYLINKFEEPLVNAYHSYQVDLAVLFGSDRTSAVEEMRLALDFEFRLAEISKSREERRDPLKDYNRMSIAELQAKHPYIDWLDYFNGILPHESQLTSEDLIVTFNVDFLDKLGDLIESTPKKVVANYVMWRVVMDFVNYLPSDLRIRQHEYKKILTGKEVREVRWQECIDLVLEHFAHAFGSLYVQKHFKESAKTMTVEMVEYIKNAFGDNLKTVTWMDEATKAAAQVKLDAMTEEIGFADELIDDAKLIEFYTGYPDLIVGEYFETIFKLKATTSKKALARLREPIGEKKWFDQFPPAIVMAYYSSLDNAILFPAGFLQGAFFNADRPMYTNFGAVGIAIGHEITHGFDDQGSLFDADGNLRDWWAPETRREFLQRTQCIIDQFENYKEPNTGLNVNGINTQGENIADTGGVKYAYRGYNKWVEDNGPEPTLPGLKYNQKQLFWISVAQIWCSVSRDAEMKNTISLGIHAPAQFRVEGPLHNSQEFAEDFSCPVGSKMNPTAKCEVW